MRHLPLATICVLIACAQSPDVATPLTSEVDQPFTLRVGEIATVGPGGASVRFVAVVADSRCPTRVQCVWAGDGAVAVETTPVGGRGRSDTLHTTLDSRTAVMDGWTLELAALAPYPDEPGGIAPDGYTATFVVRRTR